MLAAACGGGGGGGSGGRTVVPLCIATGGTESASYTLGRAFASILNGGIPGTRWSAEARPASAENIKLVTSAACDVAFAPADAAADAFNGATPTRAPQPIQALARLYVSELQLVVSRDSLITSVADLRGKVVAMGPEGSATEFTALRVLEAGGAPAGSAVRQLRHLDLDQSATALSEGRVDAFFWEGEEPMPRIVQLAERFPIRLVDVSGLVNTLRSKYKTMYTSDTVLAKTYALDSDGTTIGVPNYLVVSATMDGKLAYEITKLLFTHRIDLVAVRPEARELNASTAITTDDLPLHAGALKYYREAKP
jgi:TRAP transporter TAXI family solute receptor